MITVTFVKGPLTNPLYSRPSKIDFERVYLYRPCIDFDESVLKQTSIHVHCTSTISFRDCK